MAYVETVRALASVVNMLMTSSRCVDVYTGAEEEDLLLLKTNFILNKDPWFHK